MGSDLSHFNASLTCAGQSHETVSINHNFWTERWAEAGSRTYVLPLTSRVSYHQAKPAHAQFKINSWSKVQQYLETFRCSEVIQSLVTEVIVSKWVAIELSRQWSEMNNVSVCNCLSACVSSKQSYCDENFFLLDKKNESHTDESSRWWNFN